MRRILIAVAAFTALVSAPLSAQNVENLLSRYVGVNADGYLGPVADYLGASLNGGWTRKARVEPGFSLRLSLVAAGAPIADKRRTFTGTTDGDFTPVTTREAPTIFGPAEEVVVQGQGGTEYVFAAGLDQTLMATLVPQLEIGSVAGTMLKVRWFGYDAEDDLGDISLMGVGLTHDLSRHFGNLPVDLAVGAYWQSFEIGENLETTAILASLHASRSMGLLTLYGGLGYENSTTDIHFSVSGLEDEVDISLDGDNTVRANLGLSLKLAFFELFADYALASQNAFTIGLGIGK
jgi:hypothetical protein